MCPATLTYVARSATTIQPLLSSAMTGDRGAGRAVRGLLRQQRLHQGAHLPGRPPAVHGRHGAGRPRHILAGKSHVRQSAHPRRLCFMSASRHILVSGLHVLPVGADIGDSLLQRDRPAAFKGGCLRSLRHQRSQQLVRPLNGTEIIKLPPTCVQVHDCKDIGPHYAVTLRDWRAAWEARHDAVLKLGYSERFWRKYRQAQSRLALLLILCSNACPCSPSGADIPIGFYWWITATSGTFTSRICRCPRHRSC